jgi:hypothetical protein
MTETIPTITSFVIRFIHGDPRTEALSYRGTIRHIPSNQEVHFTRWEEAEAFMRLFVPLDEGQPHSKGMKGGL